MPEKKERYGYENAEWYNIYKKYEKEDKVFSSHRDYLMFRDMTASTVIMMLLYFVIGSISDVIPICWNGVIYLVITYIIVNSATRSRGKRFVNNVIVCDICDKNK